MSTDSFQFSTTPAQNNRTPPDGAPENHNRSDVNNILREFMAAYRTYIDDPEWLDVMRESDGDALTVSKDTDTAIRIAAADMTSYFNVGRRVKLTGGSEVEGTVVSSAFATDTTVELDIENNAVVPAGTNKVELYFGKSLGSGAFGSGIDPILIEVFT